MTVDDSLLPSFAKPPVNEVVLSVAFDRPPGLSIAHLGDFWHQHLRSDFPQIEEQAPYHRPVEILGPPAPPAMNVQLMDRPPSPRLWAKSADGTRLVQLQADWFAFNWRDAPDSELEYPRWPAIENGFLTQLRRLAEYLRRQEFGEIVARQCEVTYINQIRPGGKVWSSHADLDRVLTLVGSPDGFLPRPETLQLTTAFRLKDPGGGTDRGRVHVTAQPAFQREDNLPIIVLTLVARGEPAATDEGGVLDFLRMGHEWIVRGFADLTTPAMHEEWERLT